MSATLNVDAGQIVQLMLQFMKENGLVTSMKALQDETGVYLNTVDDPSLLEKRILAGKWDLVLQEVSTLSLPTEVLMSLYEQVVLEMLELREMDTARSLLRNTAPMVHMKRADPERYVSLDNWLNRGTFDAKIAYAAGASKQSRRADIAKAVMGEIVVVAPSRLLSIVGQAVKWQQHMGLLPPSLDFDLLRGAAPAKKKEDERPATKKAGVIRFGSNAHADAAVFTPDGQHLITGTVDGFVEVWNYDTCKVNTDLPYQAKDKFMMHDDAVQCMAVSTDSELLATGARNGKIKVWRLASGKCVRKFPRAHEEGVGSVEFNLDSTQLLSGSSDMTARVHGLLSGKLLKEFRGHTSYVNTAVYNATGHRVLTGSSDGTMKLWDVKSTDCLRSFRLPQELPGVEVPVLHCMAMPKRKDCFLVCNKSPFVFLITSEGTVLRKLEPHLPAKGGNFVACIASAKGTYIYALREDKKVYVFKASDGDIVAVTDATDGDPSSLAIHPHRNLLGTLATDSKLVLWKSSASRR